jgi:hypothetical protein
VNLTQLNDNAWLTTDNDARYLIGSAVFQFVEYR